MECFFGDVDPIQAILLLINHDAFTVLTAGWVDTGDIS